MKKRWMALVLCGVMLMPGCGKTDQPTSAEVKKAAAPSNTEDAAEESVTENVEPVVYSADDVRTMLTAMCDQTEKDPLLTQGNYYISKDTGFAKQYEIIIGRNNSTDLFYWKAASPANQVEVYREKDGHLYADIAMEEVFDPSITIFDGTKYHYQYKTESVSDDFCDTELDIVEMPVFLDASDYTIIKQETLGEHTLISCSALMEKDGERSTERHFVLCVKDGMIDGIVYGSRLTRLTYGNDPETVYSLDEIVLDADIPASVPTYFDDIEYTNTKDICDYVVWGVYEVTFDFGLETTSEEWECHSGFVNADNADLFCELLDFETFYYDVPHGFF